MHVDVGILDTLVAFFFNSAPQVSVGEQYQAKPKCVRSDVSKRIFDVCGALFLLLLSFPLMLFTAFLVRITSKGPVLYRQQRMGAGGREFSMLKFRSMLDGAESTSGEVWCAENDPRITRIGKMLRNYHIDELPQLFNVLEGSMSLVGPRPERPGLSKMLHGRYRSFDRRLQVPAGLTGLAQVHQGYCSSVEGYRRKVALDRLYVRRRSLKLDLIISLRTVLVVMNGKDQHV